MKYVDPGTAEAVKEEVLDALRDDDRFWRFMEKHALGEDAAEVAVNPNGVCADYLEAVFRDRA
jgi:hypothetical protein